MVRVQLYHFGRAGPASDACLPLHCGVTVTCFVSIAQLPTTFQVAGCSSIGQEFAATSAPPRLASQRTLASQRSMLMLGSVTSWRGRGALLVLRLTNVTNLQVKQYTYTVTIATITSFLVAQWLRQLDGTHMIVGSTY